MEQSLWKFIQVFRDKLLKDYFEKLIYLGIGGITRKILETNAERALGEMPG